MVSISISPCPNDTFSFYSYFHSNNSKDLQIHFEDIQRLNEKAISAFQKNTKEADVIKVSFAVYPYIQNEYIMLESGAALGRGCGPLLIAKTKIDPATNPQLKIVLPGKNTSANRLFERFFPAHKNCLQTSYEKIMACLDSGTADAGVIIHENRFTFENRGFVCIADLGALWAQTYGDLLPLGGIVAKRSLGIKKIREIENQIKESIQWAFQNQENAHLQKFILHHAQEKDPFINKQHIQLYVNEYSLRLGSLGRQAIRNFLGDSLAQNISCFTSDEEG